MGAETVKKSGVNVLEETGHGLGEVHNSSVPLEISLGIALTLAGLLVWPLLFVGLALVVHSIYRWVTEDAAMWKDRPNPNPDEWGHASWAMVWIILTEAIIFASFFAFWFWARWHTVNWENAVGGSWPADGIEHNMVLVTVNTLILLTSGFTGHKALHALREDNAAKSKLLIRVTALLGLTFLGIQIYEYLHAGFLWSDHAYGTAFFALTGLHGLHVLVGIISFVIVCQLVSRGYYTKDRNDSFQAVTWYWHFVDVVWILLYLIVYVEVI
ncbi:MAG: heme-copper oxidase subunit III [Euryarchaeota archaeon]|nr:heme-copper oxidase subunit III [Euryarchaeota archaeon]